MKKWIVLILVFLLSLTLFPALSAKAQSGSVVSLGEGSVVFPNSDVQLIARGAENIYALVVYQSKSFLFFSRNKGTSWQRTSSQGLPEQERFIGLKSLPGQPDTLALATPSGVYLSRDAGNRFEYLGGPTNLAERGEQITSLDIAQGDPPQVLIGVWHPARGKFPLEGVYLWGMGGERFWTEQGLRTSWQGRGYNADVTSVAFLGSAMLALATGDPDRDDPLPEATYLNLGYPSEKANLRGGEWNWISGWPVEIALQDGNSPNEKEILNSKLVVPANLSSENEEDWELFILYNSLNKSKDGVFKVMTDDVVDRPEVRRLEMPDYPPLVSLDSLAYSQGVLAAGVTVQERGKNQIQVYYLPKDMTSVEAGDWLKKRMEIPDVYNCQVLLPEKGTVCVGTSGKNSSFARSDNDFLVPISLLDIPGSIRQVSLSPRFSKDETLFLVYGESILKLRLGSDSQSREVERMPLPEGLNLSALRLEAKSSSILFLIEPKAGRVWFSQNKGLSWSRREINTPVNDIRLAGNDIIWAAGTDSKIYKSENGGKTWQPGTSSGIRWLRRLEVGPEGKILVAGGATQENIFDTISLVGEGFYNLPATGKDFEAVFSPQDSSLYYTTNGRLYRFVLEEERWEEIINLRGTIAKIVSSSQGVYLFANSRIYFSAFPLTPKSSWETLNPEVKGTWLSCQFAEISERENLLFFWDSSRIIPYYHRIPEEELEEELIPEPVKPAPVPPKPVETKPVNPEPPKPEPVKPEPVKLEPVKPESVKPEVVKPETPKPVPAEELLPPKPSQEEQKHGSAALVIAVIILSLIVVFLLFLIVRMWRAYRYYA